MGDLSTLDRRRLPAADRRRALLDAAVEVFARSGFEAARLEDIAQATGVTKAVVYRHFASKEDLFVAVARQVSDDFLSRISGVLAEEGDPRDLLARAIRVWFDWVAEHEASFLLVTGGAIGTVEARELVGHVRDEAVRLIAAAFDAPPPSRDLPLSGDEWRRTVEGLVRTIVGGAEALAEWWAETKPYPIEVAWLTVTNLCWLGLGRLLDGEIWFPQSTS